MSVKIDPEGPRRSKKDPLRLRKLRQTSQAAFAASSFSSWYTMELVQKLMKKTSKYLIYSSLTEKVLTEWPCIRILATYFTCYQANLMLVIYSTLWSLLSFNEGPSLNIVKRSPKFVDSWQLYYLNFGGNKDPVENIWCPNQNPSITYKQRNENMTLCFQGY